MGSQKCLFGPSYDHRISVGRKRVINIEWQGKVFWDGWLRKYLLLSKSLNFSEWVAS